MIEALNNIADKWFAWEFAVLWQVAVLVAIVWLIDLLIRKWAWPQVRYALWLLVLVKLILPPSLVSPASITSGLPFIAQKAVNIQISQPESSTEIATPPQQTEPIATPSENLTSYTPAQTEPMPQNITAPPQQGDIASPATVSLSWKVYALFVWLAGIVVLSAWLIIRLTSLRREHLKCEQHTNLPDRFKELLESTAQKLNLKKVPQVILTNKVCCPAVFGVFRPVLLMPADKLKNLTRADLEHILLHELAHIKRGDLFVHAVYMTLQIAYWFNPLLWLIRKQLQNLRELCCDATVAKILKEKTFAYRETLLETARQLLAEPIDPGLGLLGLFENSNWLVDRLKWLEKKTWKNRPLRSATIVILIGIMLGCVLPMAKAKSGESNDKFKAVLSNGLTVELVGVRQRNAENKTWWQPDGSKLGESIETVDLSSYDSVDPAYEFVFKTSGNGTFKVESIKGSNVIFGVQVPDRADMTGSRGHIKESVRKTNIKIASPSNNWKTIVKSKGGGSVSGKFKGKTVVLAAAEKAGNDVLISSSDQVGYKYATRLIAVDKYGKELTGTVKTDTGVNNIRQRMIRFTGLDLSEIEEFRFQTCSYEYYTFKNVLLKPTVNDISKKPEFIIKGTVTDAQTGQPIAGAKVGDGEYADGQQWITTDANGNYEYKTWYEEHSVIAKAEGYKRQSKGFRTKLFGDEKEKIINFALEKGVSEDQENWITKWQGKKPVIADMADGSVLVGSPKEENGQTTISINDTFYKETESRIIAIDNNGHMHIGAQSSKLLPEKEYRTTEATFSILELNNIREFRFQIRPIVENKFNDTLPSSVTTEDLPKLLMERRDILQKKLQNLEQKSKAGLADYKELQQAKIDLLHVEGELAESPQKRIEILEQIVDLYKDQEKRMQQLLDAGRATQDEFGKAKLQRLEAEAELAKANAEGNNQQAEFKATLPNGVTVELLGLCEHPREGKQWWNPQGSLLHERPYDDDFGRAFPQEGENGYKFAVKYSGLAGKDINAKVIPTNFKTTNGGALFSVSEKNGKENIKYIDGEVAEKTIWLGAAFNENQTEIDLRVGVCWGDWKKDYAYESDQPDDAVEWVTFKNVSLKPNFKTEVEIEVGTNRDLDNGSGNDKAEFIATLPNGVEVELLGILKLDNSTIKSWDPAGHPIEIKGILQSDIENRGLVAAYRILGENIGFRASALIHDKKLSKPQTLTSTYLDSEKIWLSTLPYSKNTKFGELQINNLRGGPLRPIYEISANAEQLKKGKVSDDNFAGGFTISKLEVLNSDSFNVHFQYKNPIDGGGIIYAIDESSKFHFSPDKLSGFVLCRLDKAQVTFRNISLVLGQFADVKIETQYWPVEKTENIKQQKQDRDDSKFATLFLDEGYTVFNGKTLHGIEALALELSSLSERKNTILQVVIASNIKNSSELNSVKHLILAWGREYGYKDVVFLDGEKTVAQNKNEGNEGLIQLIENIKKTDHELYLKLKEEDFATALVLTNRYIEQIAKVKQYDFFEHHANPAIFNTELMLYELQKALEIKDTGRIESSLHSITQYAAMIRKELADILTKSSAEATKSDNESYTPMTFTMPVYDRNASNLGQYIGGNLTRFDTDYVNLERYGLKIGDSPDKVFEKQGECAFYMKADHEFVPVRETIIAPISIPAPEPRRKHTLAFRIGQLSQEQIINQMKESLGASPISQVIKLEEGATYAIISPEKKLMVMKVSEFTTYETGKEATTLTFFNLGPVEIVKPSVQTRILTDKPPVALDLDTGKRIDLKETWPNDYEIAWDNDAGGSLFTRNRSVWMWPLLGVNDLEDTVTVASKRIDATLEGGIRGFPAKENKYVLIKTSEGNFAVLEIQEYDETKTKVKWQIIDKSQAKSAAKVEEEHWNVKTDLPPDITEQRNKLLAEADIKIRLGLVELAEQFPQLKKARDWEQDTSGQSDKGRIGIHLFHSNQGKIKTTQQVVPENNRYSVLVIVNEPPKEPTQLSMGPLYPNLGLVGQVGTTAGDPELEVALKNLVDEALEPLKLLDGSYSNENHLAGSDISSPLMMAILPRTPIKSISDYHHTYWIYDSSNKLREKTSFELCIISPDSKQLIRIPYNQSNAVYGGVQLNESQQRMVDGISDGDYLVAIYANKKRSSNIAKITIDSKFDTSTEPVLSLASLPLGSVQKLPLLGIRAVGPTPQDPELTNMSIAFPKLFVDGVPRNKGFEWSGPVAALKSGEIYTRIINLEGYEPAIEPGIRHTVKAIVSKYESRPVVIPADDSLTEQWDTAIKTLKEQSEPKRILQGRITGPDGKPANDYEVHLFGKSTERYTELSDKNGEYTFFNIPAGEYKVVCNPKGKGQPAVTIEQLIFDPNKSMVRDFTMKLDMNMQRNYNVFGKITYEDGNPADGVTVDYSCKDSTGNKKFTDLTKTDSDGKYEIGVPFENVTYIGINGKRIKGTIPTLKYGLNQLDYVLKTNENWGEMVNGLQAAVEFVPQKGCYDFGEKIGIQFKIQNVSNKTIILPTTTWRFGDESKCIITDKNGKIIPVSHAWFSGWSKVDRHEILPGEVITIKAASLMLFADDSNPDANQMVGYWATVEPGNYSIQFELQFPDISRKDAQGNTVVPLPDDWQGMLTTGTINLCVNSDIEFKALENNKIEATINPQRTEDEASLKIDKQIKELIGVFQDFQIGDRERWFAAVKELVEIGSPAVPALCNEIQEAERPQTQSVLAFTLRAIGDSNAVPALIDALKNSGFSSDYGVGKADTDLAKFIQQYQLDPSDVGVHLGRPVREITIALERLTDHAEGQEHFHAYDENGNRLSGSFVITPEIRDRQTQHRKEVAQQWQNWWDQQQKNREPRVLATPDGALLEFHVVPTISNENWKNLTSAEIEKYKENLSKEGLFAGVAKGDDYQWYQVDNDLRLENNFVTEEHKGKIYLLIAARSNYSIWPPIGRDGTWGLQKVYVTKDNRGKPAIGFEFDDKGSELFYKLTKENIGQALAIIIDGKVFAVPIIQSALRNKGIITGNFTQHEAEQIAENLQKGMPPVDIDARIEEAKKQIVSFGPVIEQIVPQYKPFSHSYVSHYLNFDSASLLVPPSELLQKDDPQKMLKFLKDQNIDIGICPMEDICMIGGLNLFLKQIENQQWSTITPEQVYSWADPLFINTNLSDIENGKGITQFKATTFPVTYLFKTWRGKTGILQITDFSNQSKEVKIQYKTIREFNGQTEIKKPSEMVNESQNILPGEVVIINKVLGDWFESCRTVNLQEIKKTWIPEKAEKAERDLKTMQELLSTNPGWKLSLLAVYWNQNEAIAISKALKYGDPKVSGPMALVWTMERQNESWLLTDIDLEALEGLQIENSRFMQKHPDANVWFDNPDLNTQKPKQKLQVEGEENFKPKGLGQVLNRVIINTTLPSKGKAIYKLEETIQGESPRLLRCDLIFDESLYFFRTETLQEGGQGLGSLNMVNIFDGEKSISWYPKEKKADFQKGRHNIPIYRLKRFIPYEILNKLLKHNIEIIGYDQLNNINCLLLHCTVSSNETINVWVAETPDIFPLKIEHYKSGNLSLLYEAENVRNWNGRLFPRKIRNTSYYKYNDTGQAEGYSKYIITVENFQPDIEIARREFVPDYPTGTSVVNRDTNTVYKVNDKNDLNYVDEIVSEKTKSLYGQEAPEFRQIKGWLNTEGIKLGSLKGKVVLLDFWGTWCPPCIASMPELMTLHEQLGKYGLVIIAIHDDSLSSVTELKKELDRLSKTSWNGKTIPFYIALDGGGNTEIEGTKKIVSGATTAAYGIKKWPSAILIDKQGRVIRELEGIYSQSLIKELEELLRVATPDTQVEGENR